MRKSAPVFPIAVLLLLIFMGTVYGAEDNDYFNKGYEKHLQGDLKNAIKDYSKAIEKNPRFAMAYQMRGAAWQRMKAFEKAINDYTMVIAVGEPHFLAVGYYNRGIAKNMSGDFSGAIPDFSAALNLDSKMAAAYFHRGIAKSRTGDDFGRIQDFREAARLGEVNAERWLNTYYPSWREPVAVLPLPAPAN
ncbi:MAG: tetratricopeptide repeat protein [Chlorobi bacterium]|nr:tetratricopeptide repeat protein [Chlorobiota bacterium]